IALIGEIARRLNLRPEIVSAPFNSIFTALTTDKFDVVISSTTITKDRRETVDFTNPYLRADQSLTVRAVDVSRLHDVDSLAGSVMGVQSGTTGENCAREVLQRRRK